MTTNSSSSLESRGDIIRSKSATDCQETMSQSLRTNTRVLHARVENLLNLPAAIDDKEDYARLLARFLGLYEPLEQSLCVFGEWEAEGFVPCVPKYSYSLTNDLTALGLDCGRISRAADGINPDLPTFSHAVGALYVLEGSALGGRFILRGLKPTVKLQIEGATTFFGARDETSRPMWGSFQVSLDEFGRSNPYRCDDVIIGAQRVFESIVRWFGPLR